jgi:hypothetical protein
MTRAVFIGLLFVLPVAWMSAQELKPVPKDSVRISIPGCAKNSVFTVGRRTADEPGTIDVIEGTHMHLNGPKKVMSDIKAHQISMIEITGLIKRSDLSPDGMSIGGVRMRGGPTPSSGGSVGSGVNVPMMDQIQLDVESWRTIPGECPR